MSRMLIPQNLTKCYVPKFSSTRWRSSTSQDDYDYWQRSKVPTMHFQKSLPRLPIPELTKTAERYLNAQKPLLNDVNFKKTEKVVQSFISGDGVQLQKELKDQDSKDKHTSYISEPWFDMYLRDRVPLPINYNPLLVFIDDPKKEFNTQLVRTSNLLISSLRFLKSLQNGVLEPEVFHLNPSKSDTNFFRNVTKLLPSSVSWYGAYMFNAFPLDMSQYEGLFNATRIPKKGKDLIYRNPSAKHVLVMRNGHFFTFNVIDSNGHIMEPEYISSCIKHILDDQSAENQYPVGVLTTENRDVWAQARDHLEKSGNKEVLEQIDSSIFCICLDDQILGEDPEVITRAFLHADGVNRWFDKSLSLLVSKDGKAAVNFEHSWGDGVAVLRYFQDIHKDSTMQRWIHPGSEKSSEKASACVTKLEFKLDEKAKNDLQRAKENYNSFTNSLAFSFFEFNAFGKNLCKAAQVSPDSVMQLGFQLAYNKLVGKYVGTYESCSTAAFKHGRTETIRPCTVATKEFCEALKHQQPDPQMLRSMLSNCSKVHSKLTREAAMGQGFDRHLFGLRKLAEKRGGTLPEIYQDPAYATINHNILSTSTLSSDVVALGGFGPVVKDGLGIGYSIYDNRLGTVVSYYKGNADGNGFKDCLEESFKDIHKALLVGAVGPASPSPHPPAPPGERFYEDVAELRSTTLDIAEQLRSFNELYVGKLEARIVSTATHLSGLHSNVERLLDRAHVWDTLQLHVAAWSEQMHTLSSKMDLLSRAQENISALEARLASLPALDYRLETVAARLEDADKRLEQLTRNVDELRLDVRRTAHETPAVVSQFATRGALASLRVVERKLDRLSRQLAEQRGGGGGGGGGLAEDAAGTGTSLKLDGSGRLLVRCHTAPAVMDILKDVSAKVDVLFDHSSGCREEEAEAEVEAVGEVVEDETDNQVIRQSAPPTETTTDLTESVARADLVLSEAVTTESVAPAASRGEEAFTTVRPADDPVACRDRDTLVRALGSLTQAVQALGVLSAFPPPSAAGLGLEPPRPKPRGCEDLVGQPSGEYEFDGHRVFCDMDTDGGGWTVVQRRGDWGEPRENFSRTWAEYAEGFGSPSKEFWIGNKWLHRLTASRNTSLRVDLWDWEGERAVAEYAVFRVTAEDDLFRLQVADYSGNATDALSAHRGRPFSTWDSNHDTAPACCPCAPAYAAGWWFYSCFEANLNGEYHTHPEENEYYRGIIWEGWRGDYSLRAASMMVRSH
ncbi:Carnitine O-palmitoyltransferase 2, mitochondrial [Frankliniella fusca]|uniref:Carnitine O-palmitoyltransferase 2, mitochondrial n=1 Tax=Frankliniella fusca TaxID=407009 RepID=A0AAE1GT48_9NEOP|nr:Carnitine O-palmitoyltransferase 2, mitochondrial [Frankliniella fusca]